MIVLAYDTNTFTRQHYIDDTLLQFIYQWFHSVVILSLFCIHSIDILYYYCILLVVIIVLLMFLFCISIYLIVSNVFILLITDIHYCVSVDTCPV